MKKLMLTIATIAVFSVILINGITHNQSIVPPEAALRADRTNSNYYKNRKASLEKLLLHAKAGSGRAFKLQSKLDRLENWREGDARMGYPEEFARILHEMRIPSDRTVPEYKPGYLYREVTKARQSLGRQPQQMRSASSLVWQSRGPGNVAGRARDIVVDPDDSTGDTWFVASVGGGVWYTANAGATWTQLMDDQPLLAMQSLAMAPSSTNILYAGTGESYFNIDTMNGNGMLRSIDGGASWSPVTSTVDDPRFNNVSRILISPTDPDVIVVSTTVGRYKSGINPTTHIFRSTDGAANWTEVFMATNSGGFSGPRVQQLIADPTDFNIQYATVNETGILKSTDAGVTWNYINTGITDFSGRFELAISPVNSDYLYVSAEGASSSVLWVSWNGGTSWSAMTNTGGSDNWLGAQGWYDNAIVCHTTDATIVYVGGLQLYQLTINAVGGNSYSSNALASYSFPHPDHHILRIVEPSGGGWYLLGTNDGGVTRTSSDVTGFTMPTDGMVTTQFYGVDKRPGASAYIGGTQDNGTWQSPSDPIASDPWDHRIGGDGYETSWHFDDPQKIMGGYQFNGLQRSLDGGVTWSSATSGLADTGGGNAPFITKIGKSWKRPDDVFAVGAQGVWRSTDFGASWTLSAISSGQWGNMSSFHDVRVSAADPDIVWAGARMDASGDIMVSTDAGVTFNPAVDYTAVTMGGISGLATHPTEPNTAYVLFSFAERPKILKTTDLGVNWTDISGFGSGSVSTNGFPDVATYDLVVWPNDPQHIWVGTEIGLVESLDGGANWALANNGLPSVGIWFLKAVEDEIIVGTHGRGIWSTTIPALVDGQVFNPLFESMAQVPSGNLNLHFNLRSAYDSTEVYVDSILTETLPGNTPLESHIVSVPVLAEATVTAYARSYQGGSTYNSTTKQSDVYPVAAPVTNYSNDLNSAGNLPFLLDGFTVTTPGGFSDEAMHTPHDYANSASYIFTLMAPIMIAEVSTLTFDEVAIVEPGEPGSVFGDGDFWDYVIVEGTTDGTTWQAVAPGWDARDDSEWLTAYNGGQPGTASMYENRSIDLHNTFAMGEVVLLRWRLSSDAFVTGWGWAVDNIVVTSSGPTGIGDTPRAVTLNQNYPNPFNPSTTIAFDLPHSGATSLKIYDVRGRLVRTLIDEVRQAGPNKRVWDGRNTAGQRVASGVYLYRLIFGDFVQTKKMTLLK
jgi:hypothetical protein